MQNGSTALMWASCQGHADIARVLVEHGASLEAVNKVNMHAACARKHVLYQGCVFDYEYGSDDDDD
jgi:ankyrin repeat protein